VRRISRRLLRPLAGRSMGTDPRSSTGEDRARTRQPVQSRCYAWAGAPDAFVDDMECPYTSPEEAPFVWIRSRQLGGRWAIPGHGRQFYRMGPDDFASSGSDHGWPLQPGELDPWYDMVEGRLEMSGRYDDLPWLPNSVLSDVLEPTPTEASLQEAVEARWPGTRAVLGRYAPPLNALEPAARSGKLFLRQGAVARRIEVDARGRVSGVAWVDAQSGTEARVEAPLVFLCASTLESTRLLLLSGPEGTASGLGASSGVLGRYLMDHLRLTLRGRGPRLPVEMKPGGRCVFLPRFDAREMAAPTAARGFGVQVYQNGLPDEDFSAFSASAYGEMLPDRENSVALHPHLKDAWGIPVLRIDCRHGALDTELAEEQKRALRELAETAGVTISHVDEAPALPGSANHECGTARMGSSPSNSVLNPQNECWEAEGLYVTDGASFPSQGSQNPTLTLLALTARACEHAAGARSGSSTSSGGTSAEASSSTGATLSPPG